MFSSVCAEDYAGCDKHKARTLHTRNPGWLVNEQGEGKEGIVWGGMKRSEEDDLMTYREIHVVGGPCKTKADTMMSFLPSAPRRKLAIFASTG